MGSTRVTRWVRAEPDEVYQALLDPFAVAAWRVPNGMSAEINEFDAREGGRFRISLHPDAAGEASRSAEGTPTFRGRLPACSQVSWWWRPSSSGRGTPGWLAA